MSQFIAFSSPLSPATSPFTNVKIGTCNRRPASVNPSAAPFNTRRAESATRISWKCSADKSLTSPWRTLDAHSFSKKLESNDLSICFVGMSNCGKSHWSNQLELNLDFHLISVDEEIEHGIRPELDALGFSGIDGMAEWMGFPSDDRFAANQATYLKLEEQITSRSKPAKHKNTVLDTTGSVVYLSETTIGNVQQDYLVVHLEASDDMLEFMTTNYFETPKPVVWGDIFQQLEGECADEALRRCYPNLLRERRKRYAAMAHVTVPAKISLSRSTSLENLLDFIQVELSSKTEQLIV